ncbi:protein DYAD-like [Chenopodium quinoa]|uniref:PTC1-like winged helix-turn-helix domain-containing protein n=1 Tax=Chenopodium quinoa TaxID=63459 RepID=A0A803LV60_CHEQI|nr:protein DYAD-like [Chenopodium quinoa]
MWKRQSILGEVGDAAMRCPLPNSHSSIPKREPIETILEGSFYEIDHSKLPLRTPAMLHYVRAVMVTSKSELNVTVRYPSAQSLEAYFGNSDHIARRSELYPALDEKFIMGPMLAVEVLRRIIPSQGFDKLKHSKSFWLIKPLPPPGATNGSEAKHGPCFSKLRASKIQGWGLKKFAAYVPNSKDLEDHGEEKSLTLGEDKQSVKEEAYHETKVREIIQYNRKRKRGSAPHSQSKKTDHIPKQKAIEIKAVIKGNNDKEFIDRWPLKRYEAAGMELVDVLKKYGADHENPISRLQLRTEARKRIGDTGLLDHMLKHLAGQVVPRDGNDRLRRRCDAEGKMEYWLESADLANIRKEAGVKDPYWIPPPGWKLGESINVPRCSCRQEVKMLKDELSTMRRQMAELKTKNQSQQPITTAIPASAASSGRETYEVLMKKKYLMEMQLRQISEALMELEKDKSVQVNKAEAAASLQLNELMPSACQSLPVEEVNEDLEEAAEELRESYEEAEIRSRSKRLIVKLKPCSQLDNISNTSLSQKMDHSVQDRIALATTSGSPFSTTTS